MHLYRLASRVAVLTAVLVAFAHAASAAPITYIAYMDGPSEDPPVPSPGVGFARVDLDLVAHTMRIRADFSGLLAPTTAAHIHAPTAVPFVGNIGVATQLPSFFGFPLGVTAGSMDQTFNTLDAGTWNPAYVANHGGGTLAGAEAAFAAHLAEGRAYFNIHTSQYPAGEIRGFFIIPEPATPALLALGGLTLLGRRRR